MKVVVRLALLLLAVALLGGCEVTEEKIELWKGTQNGPKKLAGTLIDPDVSTELRAKAAVALIEIKELDLFHESFEKMEKSDSQKLIESAAPILGEMVKGEGGGLQEKTLQTTQVDAKDGLYLMLDYAEGPARQAVIKPLVDWCAGGNYNIRAMAGSYNAQAIAKKVGGPAAMGLANTLVMGQMAIEPIAKLIRDIGDEKALLAASEKLAGELEGNVKRIQEVHLVAAAVIGGDPIADVLLELATNKEITPELRRFALRAFSMSIDTESIKPKKRHLDALFAMAENTEYDQFQREETYMTIAQAGGEDEAERISKLLSEENFFWRLVGLRCLMRMAGDTWLGKALKTRKLVREDSEVEEIILWTSKFPKLADTLRKLTENRNSFVQGVAIYALAVVGEKKDVELLKKLEGKKTRLRKGFDHKTVGEAAASAVEQLEKKG